MGVLNSEMVKIEDMVGLPGTPIAFEGVAGIIHPRFDTGITGTQKSDSATPKDFMIPLPPNCRRSVPLLWSERRRLGFC